MVEVGMLEARLDVCLAQRLPWNHFSRRTAAPASIGEGQLQLATPKHSIVAATRQGTSSR